MKNLIPVGLRDWLFLPFTLWQSWRRGAEDAENVAEYVERVAPERQSELPMRAMLAVLRWRAKHPHHTPAPTDSLSAWYVSRWGRWADDIGEQLTDVGQGLMAVVVAPIAAIYALLTAVAFLVLAFFGAATGVFAFLARRSARRWDAWRASRPAPADVADEWVDL